MYTHVTCYVYLWNASIPMCPNVNRILKIGYEWQPQNTITNNVTLTSICEQLFSVNTNTI